MLDDLLAGVLKRLESKGLSAEDRVELTRELRVLREEIAAARTHSSAIELARGPTNTARPSSSPSSDLIQRLAARVPSESRYDVGDEIARGGMGAILKAFDPELRRTLAMKVALERPSGSDDTKQRERVVRFLEEAQITSQLDHPGVVPIHELGLDRHGRLYFTMRLVRGRDLSAIYALVRTAGEDWSITRVLGVLLKVCEAMAYAHSKGVIHRDLKPANVMVGRFGEVYVMDWGLAKVLGQEDTRDLHVRAQSTTSASMLASIRSEELAADPGTPLVTMDGTVLGTPAYMSPEQASGEIEAMDVRSDVYALGAMLYHLFAGHAPYQDGAEKLDAHRLWLKILKQPPTPLAQIAPATPPELLAIVARAMAREPTARYADVSALADDLRAWLEGRVVRAYRTGAIVELKAWVKRNRATAATVAGALLLAVIGSTTFGLVEAKRRTEISRLSDVYVVDQLISDARNTWTLDSRLAAARFEGWLQRADEVLARQEVHRRDLERVEARMRQQGLLGGARDEPADQEHSAVAGDSVDVDWWQFETLGRLIDGVEQLSEPQSGLIEKMRRRRDLALAVDERTSASEQAQHAWREAIASIADPAQCAQYAGLEISPLWGLLPIGRDPQSGLWEFAHLASGEPPSREPSTGRLEVTEVSGLVLVLIPEGEWRVDPAQRNELLQNALQSNWSALGGELPINPLDSSPSTQSTAPTPGDIGNFGVSEPTVVHVLPFLISKYEMTQAQWRRLSDSNPSGLTFARVSEKMSKDPRITELHPVETVSFEDCESLLMMFALEIPSDGHWEYAVRAGTTTTWWTGDDMESLRDAGNIGEGSVLELIRHSRSLVEHKDGFEFHAPVTCFRANPFGLYGTIGNVWEWCLRVPVNPESAAGRPEPVICGGSFKLGPDSAQHANRSNVGRDRRQTDIGVRPMRTLRGD